MEVSHVGSGSHFAHSTIRKVAQFTCAEASHVRLELL